MATKQSFATDYAKPVIPKWLRYPKRLNACEELLDKNLLRGLGSNVAIRFEDESITYEQLHQMVSDFSGRLLSNGLEQSDRVIIRATNRPEFIVFLLSILRLGAIAIPTHPRLSHDELNFVAKDSGARFGVGTIEFIEEIRASGLQPIAPNVEVPPARMVSIHEDTPSAVRLAQDSPSLLLYTSGTTGRPKGCVHTHRDYLVVSDTYGGRGLNMTSSDTVVAPASLSFAFGHIANIAIPFRFGSSVALFDRKHFDPEEFLRHIVSERATVIFGVPTVYRTMLKMQNSPDVENFARTVRVCISAGEPCGAELVRSWEQKFKVKILEHLGNTEMLDGFIGATLKDLNNLPPGSLGRPLPGYLAKFREPTHYDKERKMRVGEVMIRGPVTVRYWNRPKEQRAVNRNGWNRTRDIVGLDSDGWYWYISRSDDMIKSSGYRISPHEVEQVLLRHPLVAEAAVVGVPNSDRGNLVSAFVVPRNSGNQKLTSEDLKKFTELHLAGYKVPKLFRIVPQLPKTGSGKIRRNLLIQR